MYHSDARSDRLPWVSVWRRHAALLGGCMCRGCILIWGLQGDRSGALALMTSHSEPGNDRGPVACPTWAGGHNSSVLESVICCTCLMLWIAFPGGLCCACASRDIMLVSLMCGMFEAAGICTLPAR